MNKYSVLIACVCLNVLVGPAYAMKRTLEESSTTDGNPAVHEVPNDVMVVVFTNLSIKDLFAASLVNKYWHQAVRIAKPDFYGEKGLLDTYQKGLKFQETVKDPDRFMEPELKILSDLRNIKNKFNDEDLRYMARNFASKYLNFEEDQEGCKLFSEPKHFMVPAMMIAWESHLPRSIDPYGFVPNRDDGCPGWYNSSILAKSTKLVKVCFVELNHSFSRNETPEDASLTRLLITELMFRHLEKYVGDYGGPESGLDILFSKILTEGSSFTKDTQEYAILKRIFFSREMVIFFFGKEKLWHSSKNGNYKPLYADFVQEILNREEYQFFIDQWQGLLMASDSEITEEKCPWLKVGHNSIDYTVKLFTDEDYLASNEFAVYMIKYAAFAYLQIKNYAEAAKLYEIYIRIVEFYDSKDSGDDFAPSPNVYENCARAHEMMGNHTRAQELRDIAARISDDEEDESI